MSRALFSVSLLAALALAAAVLPGCGGSTGGSGTNSTDGGGSASTPDEPNMTVTHLLVKYRSADYGPDVKRNKAQALELAKSLMGDLDKGRPFEELVEKFSEDRNRETKKPNTNNGKPGSYTFPKGMMMPAFEKASIDTPVGKFAPEPIETPYGYHIIRRDS
jgi:parvulin-like peptidyl-prolyl isomerase